MADIDWDGPILRDALERIGCAAQIVRLVTAGTSRTLDLGRAGRLASPAQRIALAAQFGGCAYPTCDRPPEWTDVHHELMFTRGGRTNLDEMLPVCRFHHRLVHEGGWRTRRRVDGIDWLDALGAVRGRTPIARA
jgi:hypothetical protein